MNITNNQEPRQIFITGTDTECGKTYVTLRLLEYYKKLGKNVLAIKPVACGGTVNQSTIENEDVLLLQKAQDINFDLSLYKYKTPVSPHIAAANENAMISIGKIVEFIDSFKNKTDILLVEGAGGLLVPLNSKQTWLDFLIATKMQTVIVVGMKLGCLNHALLTQKVLSQSGVPIMGWIANCIDNNMLELSANIKTLQELMCVPFLGKIDNGGNELLL